jgi:pyrrolidone-carboxylate peptidase
LDLRISEDAGRYLCDYIYYSSLAHLEKAGQERKVLFLHVPSDASEHSIAVGRELVLQLVRAMVESELVQREKKKRAERETEAAS